MENLDILPISAYNEAFDAYHRTCVGTDGDWESNMKQFLRCGLAFTFTGVVAADIATDALFGQGGRRTSKVNIGALKKGMLTSLFMVTCQHWFLKFVRLVRPKSI